MSGLVGQKHFASLSSGLLARKGQARPAMRPQGFLTYGATAQSVEDLGWNDMGAPDIGVPDEPVTETAPSVTLPVEMPDVLRQREVLRQEFAPTAAEPHASPAPGPVAKPRKPALRARGRSTQAVPKVAGRKAAFTLRLNEDRHLRLRLASALTHRSAQQLVTEALDEFLRSLPEIEEMAGQLAHRGEKD